jgi:hypothetical protein
MHTIPTILALICTGITYMLWMNANPKFHGYVVQWHTPTWGWTGGYVGGTEIFWLAFVGFIWRQA